MALRIIDSGNHVTGFDVSASAMAMFSSNGGACAASPEKAAAQAHLLVVVVHDHDQVEAALFGPDHGAASSLEVGATVWLASTVPPGYARSVGERLAATGVHLLDGPVSGGTEGAKLGELRVIAGGTQAALAGARIGTDACASRVFPVGDIGSGSLVKLINQVLTAANIALTAEALALAVRSGVNPAVLAEVINHSAGASRQFELRAPMMMTGQHADSTTVRTFLKDLEIAQNVARSLSFPAPLAAATQQVFTMAAGLGHLDDSDASVLRVYERFGGTDVAAIAGER